jgi:hypothetical protein
VTVYVIGGSSSGSSSGALGGPDGPPALAAIDNLHLPLFYPSSLVPDVRPADAVFVMDPVDEPTVVAQGGMLHGDPLDYGDVTGLRATLGAGRFRKSVAFNSTNGVYVVSPDGLFGTDEWTVVIAVNPGSVAATALTGTWTPWKINAGKQSITLAMSGTDPSRVLTATIACDESAWTPAGSNNTLTATKTLVAGDIPATTWTLVTVSWKASIANGLKLTIGDSTSPTSSTNSANPSWLKRPFSGAPRIVLGNGLFVGHDRASGGSEPAGVAVSDMVIYRYARTVTNQDFRPKPGITIDATTTQGTWPDALTGVVGHYTPWARSESAEATADPGATIRTAQLNLLQQAGCKHIRIAEFNERAIPTVTAGAFASVDCTDLFAHLDRFLSRGMTISMHVGFMPTAFGGGTSTAAYVQPSAALFGSSQATANTEYAKYVSAVFTALKAHYGTATFVAALKSLSFWNEPENQWTSGVTAFVDLWEAVAIKLATDHPDLPPLGGPDGGYTPGSAGTGTTPEAYQRGVIDRAAANSRPLGSAHFHPYNPMSLTTHTEAIDGLKSYLTSKGFSSVKAQPTEWGMISSVSSGSSTGPIAAFEQPHRQVSAYMAAYATAFIYEMVQRGATIGAFFRAGQQQTFSSTSASEELMGLMSNQAVPRPWPVLAAFALMWKLTGTRVAASTTFPHLRAMATKESSGRITVVYGSFRGHKPREVQDYQIAWSGLPASSTWKQWRVDTRDEQDGRPNLVDRGDQTDLPLSFDLAGLGVGCIQITPA